MIMSMKNSNDIIGNQTRDLPACFHNYTVIKLTRKSSALVFDSLEVSAWTLQ
jgi:hypothetical protein